MKRYAVSVDGAAFPSGAYDQAITVRSKPTAPNVVFHGQDIVNAIGRPLRADEDDWLDLLQAIFVSDLVCRRGRNEDFNRQIVLALPLRNPGRISPLLPQIQELFGRLTHDALQILVSPDLLPVASRYPTQRVAPIDAVALLSGGLDSACAAAGVLQEAAHPCFVASRASPHVIRAQNAVAAALGTRYGCQVKLTGFKVELRHKHEVAPLPESDLTQRSRTLLFAGVAATIAAARGIAAVTLGENGVMAINCPLTPGRVAAFSTHTAHPDVLALMGQVFSTVLAAPIEVRNPLLPKTKSDVVADLVAAGLAHLVPQTHSCWIARNATHCGACVPCIVRRIAVEIAKTGDAPYARDSFSDPSGAGDDRFGNIIDYLFFASTINSLSNDELLLEFGELNVEGGAPAYLPILNTHRRWAKDVFAVANAHPPLAQLL